MGVEEAANPRIRLGFIILIPMTVPKKMNDRIAGAELILPDKARPQKNPASPFFMVCDPSVSQAKEIPAKIQNRIPQSFFATGSMSVRPPPMRTRGMVKRSHGP